MSVQTEPGRAVSQTIGPAGGAIGAVDARGNVYALSVPENALPEEVRITMTPLSSVTGSPLPEAGFSGGVELQPEGLQFFRTATLVVVPAQPVPAADTAAFVYTGGGQNFHLTLPGTDAGSDFAIPVNHFTGFGTWNADGAAQHAANEARAATPEGQAEQAMAEAVNAWRSGDIDEQAFEEAAAKILQNFYANGIAPGIPAAMENDDAAQHTIRELLLFERTAALTGVNGLSPSEEEAFGIIQQIILKVIARAETDCAQNHHLAQVLRMIRLDREYTLVGGMEIPLETVMRCWKFQLEFDSTIHTESEGGYYTWEIKAKVPIKVNAAGIPVIEGSKAEEYATAVGEIPANCPGTDRVTLDDGTPDTFSVSGVVFGFDVESALKDPKQAVPNLTISASPGHPSETYTGYACEGGYSSSFSASGWSLLFEDFHQSEVGSGGFTFAGFEPQSGEVIGRRMFVQSHGEDSEATTITLVHTPPSG